MADDKCRVCNGEGTLTGCKKCGTIKKIYDNVQNISVVEEAAETKKEIQSELLELYNTAILKVAVGETDNKELEAYIRNTDNLVQFAKDGLIQPRTIIVMSPNRFGKTALIKTLRYYYATRGCNLSPIKTLEEFSYEYKSYKFGKRNIDFLKSADLFLLTTLDANSLTLKQDVDTITKLAEIYSKPFVITISATDINKVLVGYDKLSETTYSYKVPTLIRYKGGK